MLQRRSEARVTWGNVRLESKVDKSVIAGLTTSHHFPALLKIYVIVRAKHDCWNPTDSGMASKLS